MSNKIPAVDGVRGLALLNVLILHATGLFFPSINVYLPGTAQFGVWLFFVLSAFLLTNRFFVTGFSVKSMLSYFLGRSLRILPVFFLAAYVYYLAGFFDDQKLTQLLTLSGTFLHFWTIPVEFKFYFILPFIAYMSIRLTRQYNAYVAAGALVSLIVIQQYYYPYTDLSLGGRMPYYMPAFLCGMIASCFYMDKKPENVNPFISDMISIAVIAGCVMSAPEFIKIFGVEEKGWLYNKFLYFAPGMALFVLVQCYGRGVFASMMKSRVMTHIGNWSFSIYLWHFLILQRMGPFNHYNTTIYIVAIIACIGLGAISYYMIEEPCERFRHKIMAAISSINIGINKAV